MSVEKKKLKENPLSSLGLLSPTVSPKEEPKAIGEVQAVRQAEEVEVAEKAVIPNPPRERKSISTPYTKEKQIQWPMFPSGEVFLEDSGIPNGDKLTMALQARISHDLNMTLNKHLEQLPRSVGRSDWIREAIQNQMAKEQEILRKIREEES